MIRLRDYQLEARDAVIAEWEKGNRRTLVAAATGCGKTETFLGVLAQEMKQNERAIIMSHRLELVEQPRRRILAHWPQLGQPGVVMADVDEYAARVVVATVQTLNANGRLDRILSAGKVDYLICDECHHATSPSYRFVFDRLQEHNPDVRILGVTATPRRTDNEPLAEVFDSVAYRFGIKQAIKRGALCPFVALGVQLPVSIAEVRESGEGWDDDELGDVLKARNAEDLILSTWEERAKGQKTIAFCASVAQAHSLARRFREAGYAFEAADGTTKKEIRKDVVERFRKGELVGLVNCQLWMEGADIPDITCLLQIHPTRSDLVFCQMIGRALRTAPGKTQALIIDYVPLDARNILMSGDLLGKPKPERKAEQRAEDRGVILGCFGINSDGEGLDGDPDDLKIQILDYLASSRLSWTFDGDLASTAIGEKTTLAVTMPDKAALERLSKAEEIRESGDWNPSYDLAYERVKRAASYKLFAVERFQVTHLGAFLTWDDVCDVADEYYAEHGDGVLSKKQQAWRRKAASDKQKALLSKFGIWEPGMDRGRAAQAITHHFARKAVGL